MEPQVFGAFLTWGVLGLIALGTGVAAWKIITSQNVTIKEIANRSTVVIENNTAAMTLIGERMTNVEVAVERLDDRLENVENAIEKENE